MMVYLGSDHAGYTLKKALYDFLLAEGYGVDDLGAYQLVPGDDYPDFIYPVAREVAKKPDEYRGIVIGGSGQGEAMVANRMKGARAVVFYGPRLAEEAVEISGRSSDDPYEIVRLSRLHNNANILSIGARFVTEEEAKKAVKLWLETEFDGEDRHVRRIKKIDNTTKYE